MKVLFPEPKTAAEAGRICRIIERAKTLEADGYRLMQAGRTKMWGCFKPENTAETFGYRDYSVDMTPGAESCSCEGFANDHDCKHRIAVAMKIEADTEEGAMWDAICAEHEARTAREEEFGY